MEAKTACTQKWLVHVDGLPLTRVYSTIQCAVHRYGLSAIKSPNSSQTLYLRLKNKTAELKRFLSNYKKKII